MDSKQTTPSVIAKLMGLNEVQPQHVHHRPIKVLSEDYLRKTASIALLQKSSVHLNCSRRTKGKQHGTKPVFESETVKMDIRNTMSAFDVKPIQGTVREKFSFAREKNPYAVNFHQIDEQNELKGTPKDLRVYRNSGKMSAERNLLISFQKVGNSFGECGAEYQDKLSGTHPELKVDSRNISKRIVVLKPNSRKAQNCARDVFFTGHNAPCQGSDKDYMERGSCLKSKSIITENKNASNGMYPLRRKYRAARLVEKKAVPDELINVGTSHTIASRSRSTIENSTLLLPEATPCQDSFNLRKREAISNQVLNGSLFSREAKGIVFERWKTTKYFQEVAVLRRRCSLVDIFGMHDGGAKPKSLYPAQKNSCSSESLPLQKDNSELCTPLVRSSNVSSLNEHVSNLASPAHANNSSVADKTPDPNTKIKASQNRCLWQKETGFDYSLSNSNIVRLGSHYILPSQLNQGVQDLEADVSSDIRNDLTQQKSSYDSPKGELTFTRTTSDSGSVKDLREINQSSPNSVLEPAFNEENDRVFELCQSPELDLSGLAMKLHLLNYESEEISLEGSVMAVSIDEDAEKGCLDLSQDYEKLWGPFKPEESRDFSYLTDVLDEASAFGLNLDAWCETWHETENPLSPLVFETLEKKYGKQTSWLKSERRLLFDYINSGLRAIQDSCMDFGSSAKPLRRKFSATRRKSDIAEELWMQLTQEKEAKKDTSEKAFGAELRWMELEDDISTICKEIADFLFDELATETCST